MRRLFLPAIAMVCLTSGMAADELPRPVVQQYRLESGATDVTATYLSPLRYSGSVLGASGTWSKAFNHAPESTVMRFEANSELRDMLNPAKNAQMIGLDGNFTWGMEWRKRLPYALQVTAGGSADIYGGILYLTRNGNNPVSINAYPAVAADASLSWRFNIGKLPCLVYNRVHTPVAGAFFSPQYGETYYEIYLGNHSGLARFGWWGNSFRIDNRTALILDCTNVAWEIGYTYRHYNATASYLTTNINSHLLSIGVIPHGIGLKKRAQINSPLY